MKDHKAKIDDLRERFEHAAKCVADAIYVQDPDGVCLSDLDFNMYEFRGVIFEIEELINK